MPIMALEPPPDAPPHKRGPGRPKGSKNKPKSAADEFAAGARTAPNGDDAPGGERPKTRRKRVSKKVTEDIEGALAEILTAPSMIAAIQGDEWAVHHFVINGKELAHRIAEVSERHSQLRAWCESLLEGESIFLVGMAAVAYVLPALLHYNLIPGPDGLLGVPRKAKKSKHGRKTTGSPTDGTEWNQRGTTSQQEYEAASRQAEAEEAQEEVETYGDDDVQYAGEEDGAPPTFVEV